MKDLPWFPFYVSRFLGSRRVRRFSAEQVGIYILLLCEQWEGGAIPDVDADLARFSHSTASNARNVLEQCFDLTDDGWINPELAEIKEEQDEKRDKRVRAGAKGGRVKAKNRLAKLQQCSSKPLAVEKSRVEESRTEKSKETVVYEPEFLKAWTIYPKREGSNPKMKAGKAWAARVRAGVKPSELLEATERYRKFCDTKATTGSPYVMQASTFYGPDERWKEDYTVDGIGTADRKILAHRMELEGMDLSI